MAGTGMMVMTVHAAQFNRLVIYVHHLTASLYPADSYVLAE
jgi:hypothetical protein